MRAEVGDVILCNDVSIYFVTARRDLRSVTCLRVVLDESIGEHEIVDCTDDFSNIVYRKLPRTNGA